MARMARLYLPDCPQHLIQRGNNRTQCFHEESDYRFYLDHLQEAASEHGVAIHAYVLMTNHVHLLLTPSDAGACGGMMQSLGRRYVRYFNDRYGRTGTLWEGRYKSTLVDSDAYFFAVSRYIELNPVRANMVRNPAEYHWSSYGSNALGFESTLLTRHKLYVGLGRSDVTRQSCYRDLFDREIEPQLLEELRDATNHAWVFGTEKFKKAISATVNRRAFSKGRGGNRRSAQ